jgi:hypothetical protein
VETQIGHAFSEIFKHSPLIYSHSLKSLESKLLGYLEYHHHQLQNFCTQLAVIYLLGSFGALALSTDGTDKDEF